MSSCENCGENTSNMLVAECGYTYVCEDCVDNMWSSGSRYNSDGVKTNLWNEYRKYDE